MNEIYDIENLYFAKITYTSQWSAFYPGIVTIDPNYHAFQKQNKKYVDVFNRIICYPDDPGHLFLICFCGGNCASDIIPFKNMFPEYKESKISSEELLSKLSYANSLETRISRVREMKASS